MICASESLEILQLARCQEVSDLGMVFVAKSHLCELHLCQCLGITDAGFAPLLGSNKLARLLVQDCPAISETGILGVAKTVVYKSGDRSGVDFRVL